MPWHFFWIIPLTFLVLWLTAFWFFGRRWRGPSPAALEALQMRLVKGEIDEDEYRRLLGVMRK